MKAKHSSLISKLLVWLAAELILNSLGMDALADYGEFIFDAHRAAVLPIHSPR